MGLGAAWLSCVLQGGTVVLATDCVWKSEVFMIVHVHNGIASEMGSWTANQSVCWLKN